MSIRTSLFWAGAVAAAALFSPAFAGNRNARDELARDVDRAASVRAVKNLQRTYAQYSQYGLWREMAALFASDATYVFDDDKVTGRAAIAAYLTAREGGGHQGLLPGEIHAEILDHPVVNLSVDGDSATGRWYGLLLQSDAQGNAGMRAGVFENRYVRRGGKWQISVHHFYPQYAGPYETGWTNWKGRDLGILPYHFTPDEAGVPVPPPVGAAHATRLTLAQLESRVAELDDENLVRNLQAAYGYYVDRRMWDDVADLFAADAVYEVGGVGIYKGQEGVRKALARMGPAGLTHGVLNDRVQFDTVVSIAPGRREARVRGLELGMLGEADKGEGFWEVSIFDNRFVKEGGLWKVREMRVFPLFRSEYRKGWGRSRIVETAQPGALAPDRPLPAADAGGQDRIIPAFVSVHPVTGKPVAAPAGMRLVAAQALTDAIAAPASRTSHAGVEARLREAERKVMVAEAYDGAENVSSSYGFFADDSQWDWLAQLFGREGTKQIPFAGYYKGFARISQGLHLEYGDPVRLDATKASVAFHWRIQPFINVAPDGRSARVRTYLFHPDTARRGGGTLFGAMYPDDHLILEDGIWRLWNLSLDEPYFEMPNWQAGWAGARDRVPAPPVGSPRPAPPTAPAAVNGVATPPRPQRYVGAALVAVFKPDVPITELGRLQEHFRGGTGEAWDWPQILPMWWGYKNPVSGRQPGLFLPDCVPCDYAPEMSMARHGYLLPSGDPVRSED
ncbi:MAG TPA: nuclear transport factor 2 family protein [Steroidobacteraceae bacterium]|nr:nuclear transport factor 2 family protein [Steroidobacteraceae bacterium]